MPTVNIPGLGQVNFPDSMSNDEITAQSQKLFRQYQTQQPAPAQAPQVQEPQQPTDPQFGQETLPSLEANPKATPLSKYVGPSDFDKFTTPIGAAVKGLVAGADMALSFGTGAFGQAIGGVNAISDVVSNSLGITNVDPAATVAGAEKAFTYAPKSEGGQEVLSKWAPGAEIVDNALKDSSAYLSGGNPELATIIYTMANSVPYERVVGGTISKLKAAALAAKWEAKARELGVTLGGRKMDQQIASAATNLTDVPQTRGTAMADVAGDLQTKAHNLQVAQDVAYENARYAGGNVFVNTEDFKSLAQQAQKIANGYDADTRSSSRVRDVIDGLKDQIEEGSKLNMNADRSMASLNDLDLMRRRISRGLPQPGNFSGTDKAMLEIKGALDDFIDTQFEKGLVSGDPTTLELYKKARGLTRQYYDQFETNKVIYRMATDLNASPEDFRKYVFGLSETGAKTEATQVIKKLKEIFGDKSTQINAMRTEFLVDALQPLQNLKEPNIAAFVKYYDSTIRKNQSLVRELSPFAADGLEDLYKIARAKLRSGDPFGMTFSIPTIISRFAIGHQIARKGAEVRLGAGLLETIFGRNSKTVKKDMLKQLTEGEVSKPMFVPESKELRGVWSEAVLNNVLKQDENDNADVQ